MNRQLNRFRQIYLIGLLPLLVIRFGASARAETVLGGRDSSGNLNNSGTNLNPPPQNLGSFVGEFGGFLGTPIAPGFFVTATHIGNAGNGIFQFDNGATTPTTYHVALAATLDDLAIWKVTDGQSFSTYAPLYTSASEAGHFLVSIGNGSTRGNPVVVNGNVVGWTAGSSGTTKSWGLNTVGSIVTGSQIGAPAGFGGDLLRFTFDRVVDTNGNLLNPDNTIFGSGDSGGPTFEYDPKSKTYKLAGVNSLVDTVSMTPNGATLNDALFDARGFYAGSTQITGSSPVPLGSYATRISTRIDFINTTLGVPESSTVVQCICIMTLIATFTLRRQPRRSE